MKTFNNHIFYIVIILFISCDSSIKQTEYDFRTELTNSLGDWNLLSEIDILTKGDTLNINILFLKNTTNESEKKSDFFLDKGSNQIIVYTLIDKYYEQMKGFSSINIELEFESYSDIANYSFDTSELTRVKKYYSNKTFVKNVNFSLKNFNYAQINLFKSSIKFISESSEKFELTDDYWNLLMLFSDYCESKSIKHLNETELFILMVSYINEHDQFNEDEYHGTQENLKIIISNCGLNTNILNMNYQNMGSYLRQLSQQSK